MRNYLSTEALVDLRQNFDVEIVADSELSLLEQISQEKGYLGTYSIARRAKKLHQTYFEMLMWRFRKKSPTFLYRWMRIANWESVTSTQGARKFLFSFFRWLLSSLLNPRAVLSVFLGSFVIFPLAHRCLRLITRPSRELQQLLQTETFDLIIFPSSAYEAGGIDLIRLGAKFGVPTLALIDNWDNLSSKTVFLEKPTYLGVWSEQMLRQAREIHGFESDRVFLLGNPRFEAYYPLQDSRSEEGNILFVGSAMPFDEIAALKALDLAVDDYEQLSGMKIIYRPHPWQQKRKVAQEFQPLAFKNVILDEQIADAKSSGVEISARNTGFQPDLEYYPRLLSAARLVVGPLTTMLFEAVLCGRPVLALSYSDGIHFTTSLRYFSHFEGLDRLSSFVFCDSRANLEKDFFALVTSEPAPLEELTSVTRHYLYKDDLSYSQRLMRAVGHIVSAEKAS